MTLHSSTIHLGGAIYQAPEADVTGGFITIEGERYAQIANVDQLSPFLMSIPSDSDCWLFVGSSGPFTAGRRSPDDALFPYQTVDKILRHPATSGALTVLLVSRGDRTALWEPGREGARVYRISRNLYKRVDATEVLFEEINHDLGLRFRWSLAACEPFGIVRRAEIAELSGSPAEVRYLDGWHQLLPPGVGQDSYARLSYLAAAYMRHERLPGTPLAIYSLNAAISDRAEPSESLRVAAAWSTGHGDPTILLSDRQLAAFRRGDDVQSELEVRGEIGAYLVADRVRLEPRAQRSWRTVGDTRLDHAAVVDLRDRLAEPGRLDTELEAALLANRAGLRRRVAAADGLQQSADEAVSVYQDASVLFNIMRGGSFENGYEVPPDDLTAYLADQDRPVLERHGAWILELPARLTIQDLLAAAARHGDPQLLRLVASYLPLTFSRRHGDPSRPWNRFSIKVRDAEGRPVHGYEGNWRDIFQNWEALGESFPGYLRQFVSVFLNASTADGYNPYRITRSGIDWEVEDPRDPWSHIGYWGDHQILYLLRLLEAWEHHEPGALATALGDRTFAYANVPYRIAGFATILRDPRATIAFDRKLHDQLQAEAARIGADGKLLRDADGEVRLVTLAEKLLVPLLVKLTNFVPGGGIWLNTQRPEWNDANNALAGWGLSMVTLSSIRQYLGFLGRLFAGEGSVALSGPVALLVERLAEILSEIKGPLDDEARYRVIARLGRTGEEHRRSVYAGEVGTAEATSTPLAAIRELIAVASPVVDETLCASRRADGLYHSYNLLRIGGERAAVDHLGPMLEGQVAILESGLLTDQEAVDLLRALRASEMYRADQRSYLLYPDRALTPFLERNTLAKAPTITDPSLFVADRKGAWHFQADLSSTADVERQLLRLDVTPATRAEVLDLWRTTFAHDQFTGRSGTFFMFEGLGSIYWHMVAKLLRAAQVAHQRAVDPAAAAELAKLCDDIRDGLSFRKSPEVYGAFPTDPYSHSPRHRGAQQPGMTGQVKEQILTRFGELGVTVADGRLRFAPSLLHGSEFDDAGARFTWLDVTGAESAWQLPSESLAFTYCQVAVCYRLGDAPGIELQRADGASEFVAGNELGREASASIFERRGVYMRLLVTVDRAAITLP